MLRVISTKNRPFRGRFLLGLFVDRVLFVPRAVLLELNTSLQLLLVLVGVVVCALALGALEFDEVVLRHSDCGE